MGCFNAGDRKQKAEGTGVEAIFKKSSDLKNDLGLLHKCDISGTMHILIFRNLTGEGV